MQDWVFRLGPILYLFSGATLASLSGFYILRSLVKLDIFPRLKFIVNEDSLYVFFTDGTFQKIHIPYLARPMK